MQVDEELINRLQKETFSQVLAIFAARAENPYKP
jgi:hypothetical protein